MKNIVKLNVNFFSLAYILRRIEKKTRRNNIEIRKIQFYTKTYTDMEDLRLTILVKIFGISSYLRVSRKILR